MSNTPELIPLPLSRVKPAATVLAHAFQDDSFFTYTIPDPATRTRVLPWLFAKIIWIGFHYGQVYTTPSLEGVTAWLGPETPSLSNAAIVRSGIFLLPTKLRVQDFARSARLGNYADRLHKGSISGRHLYLYEVGTEPQYRGQGIGRALIQFPLIQADRDGLRCYLDTYNEKNIPIYERNGYVIVAHGRASIDSPPIWAMIREPR